MFYENLPGNVPVKSKLQAFLDRIFTAQALITVLCWTRWYFPYKNRQFWSKEEYRCTKGFHLWLQECIDIDECAQTIDWCGNLACENSIGAYTCYCPTGTEVAETFDFEYQRKVKKCLDIDECQKLNICPRNSICNNNEGSYHCTCNKGFEGL